MRTSLLIVCVLAMFGCQKGHPTWTTLSVRDAASKRPVPAPLIAIQPQEQTPRGTRAASRADAAGTARFMVEQGAIAYRITVKTPLLTEHADLPTLVEGFDDDGWFTTQPDGAFEIQLTRDKASGDPFAGFQEPAVKPLPKPTPPARPVPSAVAEQPAPPQCPTKSCSKCPAQSPEPAAP